MGFPRQPRGSPDGSSSPLRAHRMALPTQGTPQTRTFSQCPGLRSCWLAVFQGALETPGSPPQDYICCSRLGWAGAEGGWESAIVFGWHALALGFTLYFLCSCIVVPLFPPSPFGLFPSLPHLYPTPFFLVSPPALLPIPMSSSHPLSTPSLAACPVGMLISIHDLINSVAN